MTGVFQLPLGGITAVLDLGTAVFPLQINQSTLNGGNQ